MSELKPRTWTTLGSSQGDEDHFRVLFESAPVALAEEDYTEVQAFLAQHASEGLSGLTQTIRAAPELITESALRARVLRFNRAFGQLFGTTDSEALSTRLPSLLLDARKEGMLKGLMALQRGERFWEVEAEVETLGGAVRNVVIRWLVPPGEERSWSRVLICILDTTERDQALIRLKSALEEVERLKNRFQAERTYLEEEIRLEHNFGDTIGEHSSIHALMDRVRMVAPTDATVLITGETGTGKELIARAVHNLSARRDRPLVKVNCGAIADGLVESELFGHEKGAFTSAFQQRRGRFELAHGGTIFLDEVGELPSSAQVKLLRVLQEQEFERVGGVHAIRVDVRIIAATNRDLTEAVHQGRMRADLFFRLNVFPLRVPPLRDRKSDIPLLAGHFLHKVNKQLGRSLSHFSPRALAVLSGYEWPGNVRELRNAIERAAIVATGNVLDICSSDLAPESHPDVLRRRSLEVVERQHILDVLEHAGWVIDGPRGAAKILEMPPSTLRSRLKRLGIRRGKRSLSD